MLTRTFEMFGLMLAFFLGASLGQAEEWGSIEGQFVIDGNIDVPGRFANGVVVGCGGAAIPDESLVIHPKNGGIANIIVSLKKAPSDIHPDLQAIPTDKLICDRKGCRFVPHVMTVRLGQTVNCINSDITPHMLHTNPSRNEPWNFVVQPNDKVGQDVKFDVAETLPVKVVCDIHSWMDAYWVVTDHPYVAVTGADGKFKIENLPVGEHSFRVWHERQGYLNREYKVKVEAGKPNMLKPEKVPVAKLAKK